MEHINLVYDPQPDYRRQAMEMALALSTALIEGKMVTATAGQITADTFEVAAKIYEFIRGDTQSVSA